MWFVCWYFLDTSCVQKNQECLVNCCNFWAISQSRQGPQWLGLLLPLSTCVWSRSGCCLARGFSLMGPCLFSPWVWGWVISAEIGLLTPLLAPFVQAVWSFLLVMCQPDQWLYYLQTLAYWPVCKPASAPAPEGLGLVSRPPGLCLGCRPSGDRQVVHKSYDPLVTVGAMVNFVHCRSTDAKAGGKMQQDWLLFPCFPLPLGSWFGPITENIRTGRLVPLSWLTASLLACLPPQLQGLKLVVGLPAVAG